jgi:hypothetical protein
MADLTSSQVFSGVSKSLANYTNPIVQADRASARLLKQQREEQLAQLQATQNERGQITNQEMQLTIENNRRLLADSAKRRVYDSFDRYTGDGDTRHLNTMLQDLRSNPEGQKLFGDWVRVDKLTEADRGLFAKQGLDPNLIFSNPETMRSIVKGTKQDGEVKLIDLDSLYRATGYSKYMSEAEMKRQLEVAKIYKSYRETGATTALERHIASTLQSEGLEPGSAEYEARRQELWTKEKTKAAPKERLTAQEREARREALLEGGSPETFDERMQKHYSRIVNRDNASVTQKDMGAADEAKAALDSFAGGSFTSLDLDDLSPQEYSEVEGNVEKIERFGKLKWSEADKKSIAAIRDLITLAEPGVELSPEKVGWFDDITGSVKKYISDEVKGIDATSAYTTYVNTLANALYGSALSAGEIERLNRQFGNLKQQTGPVLAQFKTGLTQLRSKLDNISRNTNSYVTHFRLGVDKEQLDQIVNRLDERIEFISGYGKKSTENSTVNSGKSREDLLNILGGKK